MPRPNAFRNKFVCFQCTYSTYSSTHLKDHVRTHTGEKPYKCDFCTREFITGTHLRKHLKSAHNQYNFVLESLSCRYCGNVLPPDVLEIATHCQVCHYMPRPDLFRNKYVCYQCTYKTYSRSHIVDHIRIHTGDKPYKCQQCGYLSSTGSNLKKHIKYVHRS
ncbi:zinc finger protein 317-like [Diaphorina citri]|uniref:Zinc finger protein 317-like n=1 Tax=Diaphorina citri TaxID=121845 RepID=A0A3Q0JJU2_DIACI|nr:zinc finger protein 317-like [Diaphorina citri]